MESNREVRLLQRDSVRGEIFALVDDGGAPFGYGPLRLNEIWLQYYADPSPTDAPGDPELGASLAAGAGFHLLDDFFRFYGYPDDVIAWIEATPLRDPRPHLGYSPYEGGGREAADVAARLGLDEQRLRLAGYDEGIMHGSYDPAGDEVFYTAFDDNWAVADPTGRVTVNPNAYRFKAWLSMEAQP